MCIFFKDWLEVKDRLQDVRGQDKSLTENDNATWSYQYVNSYLLFIAFWLNYCLQNLFIHSENFFPFPIEIHILSQLMKTMCLFIFFLFTLSHNCDTKKHKKNYKKQLKPQKLCWVVLGPAWPTKTRPASGSQAVQGRSPWKSGSCWHGLYFNRIRAARPAIVSTAKADTIACQAGPTACFATSTLNASNSR